MLGIVDEHVQLATVYHMNTVSVHPCHMLFSPAPLFLPSLSNVLPAMILQSRVVRLHNRCASYTSSHSGYCRVPSILPLNRPSDLGRRMVGVVFVLLLLLSGDIEMNPGPVGEFLLPVIPSITLI